jgi:L-lactate dehydrogenase complex protein LldG
MGGATQGKAMNARETILDAIKRGRGPTAPSAAYRFTAWTGDCAAAFSAKAKANFAKVTRIGAPEDAPGAVWAILSEATARPHLHLPADSQLRGLPWGRAPGLTLSADTPSGEDTAFSAADAAIAETGTLVFLSGPRTPSSWHFLPGREIVLIARSLILARFEDVMASAVKTGAMPATVNLVSGPSRTADVEQTIELGAHGPRELHILITG